MSAELLREAACLMRERAEAATPGPWEAFGDHLVWPSEKGPAANDPILAMFGEAHDESATHIASWHPAVAIAVADWLEVTERDTGSSSTAYHAALTVARAYLGSES